jgi:hypothetical protein
MSYESYPSMRNGCFPPKVFPWDEPWRFPIPNTMPDFGSDHFPSRKWQDQDWFGSDSKRISELEKVVKKLKLEIETLKKERAMVV